MAMDGGPLKIVTAANANDHASLRIAVYGYATQAEAAKYRMVCDQLGTTLRPDAPVMVPRRTATYYQPPHSQGSFLISQQEYGAEVGEDTFLHAHQIASRPPAKLAAFHRAFMAEARLVAVQLRALVA